MNEKRCYGCMRLKQSSPICEHCGFDEGTKNEAHQLSTGTVLKEQYLVGKVLGQGGFGITYIGWDLYLDIPVAIKEYYPNGLVTRDCSLTQEVTSIEMGTKPRFQNNKERFLREAKMLARFADVPEIVQIRNFFMANNTAYIVMEYVEGITLKSYVRQKGGRLSVEETFAILRPIMDALARVHRTGLIHRDISPDNIMMLPTGGAKLLDFGAVRDLGVSALDGSLDKATVASQMKKLTQSTEAILKQGYAPIEQYQSRGSLGPWTDVYALCATIYYCLTGEVPPEAPERLLEDSELNLRDRVPELSQAQETAILKGMALRPELRTGTVGELCQELIPDPAPMVVIRYRADKGGSVAPERERAYADKGLKGSLASSGIGWRFVNWTDESGAVISDQPKLVPPEQGGNRCYTAHFAPDRGTLKKWGLPALACAVLVLVLVLALAMLPKSKPLTGVLPNGVAYELAGTELVLTGYQGEEGYVVIPWEVDGQSVTSIKTRTGFPEVAVYLYPQTSELTWKVSADDRVTITGYTPVMTKGYPNLAIPAKLEGMSVVKIQGDVFRGNETLTGIILPEGIEHIAGNTFNGCTALEQVILPEGLRSIGIMAFFDTRSLTHIDLPDSLERLGDSAFAGSGLTSLRIPKGLTTFYSGALTGCPLSSVEVDPENPVFSMRGELMYDGDILAWAPQTQSGVLHVPEGTVEVGLYTASGSSYTSVEIPASVESIEGWAFSSCGELTSVTMEEGVETIRMGAFNDCGKLSDVTIPRSVTSIDTYAFTSCNLESVTISRECSLGPKAFDDSVTIHYYPEDTAPTEQRNRTGVLPNGVEYELAGTELVLTGYQGEESYVVIPWEVDGQTVMDITTQTGFPEVAVYLYPQTSELTWKVSADNRVTITDYRPVKTKGYPYLAIPAQLEGMSVVRIQGDVFRDNETLTGIILPEGIEYIAGNTFNGCTALEQVLLPEGLRTIEMEAFANTTSLTHIDLPDSLERLGDSAFANTPSLTYIDLPDNLERLGDGAFAGSGLTSLRIPKGMTWLYGHCLAGCPLGSVEVDPENPVFSMRGELLYSEDYLVWAPKNQSGVLHIPEGTTGIGYYAACESSYTSVEIPASVKELQDGVFASCGELTSVIMEEGVEVIRGRAFADCGKLSDVTVPRSVTTIDAYAFTGCNLKSVTISRECSLSPQAFDDSVTITYYD